MCGDEVKERIQHYNNFINVCLYIVYDAVAFFDGLVGHSLCFCKL